MSTFPEFATLPEYPDYRFGRDGRLQSRRRIGRPDGTDRVGEWRVVQGSVNRKNRYTEIHLTSPDGKVRSRHLHEMLCRAFHGPRPPGMQAAFVDGDRSNLRVENLTWATRADVLSWSNARKSGEAVTTS